MALAKRAKEWERNLRKSYNVDLSTPENRRRAAIYNDWFDHAILRRVWTNFDEVAPGVYRSNQPTHARFEQLKARGITTILNLRGATDTPPYFVEEESCRALGLNLINISLFASKAMARERLQELIAIFKTIDLPFLMHCKSGADRTSLAAAIWLMVMEDAPVDVARKQLSIRYIHLKWTKKGIVDYILESYAAHNDRNPISFEDWIDTVYDHNVLQHRFDNRMPVA